MREHFEANLASSKDTFIANVSHGLRTPLTGVVGFSHLLESADLGPEEQESVKMIIAESAELSRMVDDLVTGAQLDAEAVTVAVEAVSMLDEVEKVYDFMDMVGAEIGIDILDVDVMVDPTHFSQVLRNLLTNAHRHGKPTITVRGTVSNGKYICHVVDQGPGVATDDQSRLFSRFSSSVFGSQFSGAVGIGLAVVAELTSRMGCEISYRRIRGETQSGRLGLSPRTQGLVPKPATRKRKHHENPYPQEDRLRSPRLVIDGHFRTAPQYLPRVRHHHPGSGQ